MAFLLAHLPAIAAALVVILKGIFGHDTPHTTKTVDVDGTPAGPALAERLRTLARAKGSDGDCFCEA